MEKFWFEEYLEGAASPAWTTSEISFLGLLEDCLEQQPVRSKLLCSSPTSEMNSHTQKKKKW